jgi:porphobilinogen synthase
VVPPQDLASRPRRNRRSATVREAFRETILTPSNFIYPIFVHDGEEDIPIASMPGQSRLGWKTGMIDKVREARAAGVNQVVVFPKTPDNLKTETAEECFNPDGLAQRSISLLKDTFPDLEVYTDVALDPYNTMGHDGMVRSDGVVMNDETVYYLCKQAVSQARAGADVISPSDMMDGRVGRHPRGARRRGLHQRRHHVLHRQVRDASHAATRVSETRDFSITSSRFLCRSHPDPCSSRAD